MSIDNAIEQYLMWKSTHTKVAPTRYRPRLEQFKTFINQNGQSRELASISGNDIIQYHLKMANEKMYSDKTIAYSGSILKDFFNFWHGRGEAKLNPKEIKQMKCVSGLRPVVT